jgi:hypothetical protein
MICATICSTASTVQSNAGTARYRLKLAITELEEPVVFQPNTSITRYNYTLTAHYDSRRARCDPAAQEWRRHRLRGVQCRGRALSLLDGRRAARRQEPRGQRYRRAHPHRSSPSICGRSRKTQGDPQAMEVKASAAERFVGQFPSHLVAALVYGPDQGLVRERAATVAKSVLPDLNDPFRVAELDESTIESDPARLWDEAAALSMIGGRRVVRVRSANNGLAPTFQKFLAAPPGDALIVIEAGDLAKSGALRRVFEGAEKRRFDPVLSR